jgi:hypothetical protein
MRCNACNRLLSDFEATRRHAETGDFLDLCNRCLQVVNEQTKIPAIERNDLLYQNDTMDDEDDSNLDPIDNPFKM